jgi:CheY-like chemotaxis protein
MKVLIAEDDAVSALVLRRALEGLGHEVTVAVDGAQAWRIFQETRPRLIVTDWMMPELDGPGLCRRIRSLTDGPFTYIIMHTAKREPRDRLDGLKAGANAFLPKPLNREDLASSVDMACQILVARDRRAS